MSGSIVEGRLYKIRGWASHASIVVFGMEFDYGAEGIQMKFEPCTADCQTQNLGTTDRTKEELLDFIDQLKSSWGATDYKLLGKNCQHFISELCEFLRVENFVKNNIEFFEKFAKIPGAETASSSFVKSNNTGSNMPEPSLLTLGLAVGVAGLVLMKRLFT